MGVCCHNLLFSRWVTRKYSECLSTVPWQSGIHRIQETTTAAVVRLARNSSGVGDFEWKSWVNSLDVFRFIVCKDLAGSNWYRASSIETATRDTHTHIQGLGRKRALSSAAFDGDRITATLPTKSPSILCHGGGVQPSWIELVIFQTVSQGNSTSNSIWLVSFGDFRYRLSWQLHGKRWPRPACELFSKLLPACFGPLHRGWLLSLLPVCVCVCMSACVCYGQKSKVSCREGWWPSIQA